MLNDAVLSSFDGGEPLPLPLPLPLSHLGLRPAHSGGLGLLAGLDHPSSPAPLPPPAAEHGHDGGGGGGMGAAPGWVQHADGRDAADGANDDGRFAGAAAPAAAAAADDGDHLRDDTRSRLHLHAARDFGCKTNR